ncbi:MAG: hypothetical protein OES57_16695 [Acidimicrobiia bacterium]|nr:hypothetical protein [Acidimicrobiia bacterium]
MRLILHIGMPKTGTSTLQGALIANRDVLARAGAVYPEPLWGKLSHNYLTSLVQPMEDMPREFASGGEDFEASRARGDQFTFDAIRARGEEFWRHVRRQATDSGADVVIVSSEYCYGLADHKIESLRSMLAELTDDIEVVCYVRHPAEYYVSLTQQMVRASHQIVSPARFRMRARECLARFQSIFDGRVRVRPYDRTQLLGRDIVTDFVTSFVPSGADVVADLDVVDRNESMSAEAMCILQRLRRHEWADQNGQFAPESTHVRLVLNADREGDAQTPARLDPKLDTWIVARHRDDLAFLREQFGIDLGTDHEAIAAAHDEGPPPVSQSHDLAEILAVDESHIEHTLYALVRSLADRDLHGDGSDVERRGLRLDGGGQ